MGTVYLQPMTSKEVKAVKNTTQSFRPRSPVSHLNASIERYNCSVEMTGGYPRAPVAHKAPLHLMEEAIDPG